jgi:hypothetical protein
LQSNRLINIKKNWKAASTILLLDPESGTELHWLGRFFQQRLDGIPVFDRYKQLLKDYDPRDSLRQCRGPVLKLEIHCPFCKRRDGWRSFTFEVDETNGIDWWKCFKCKRSGDSARLWAKLEPWMGKADWRSLLTEGISTTALGDSQAETRYSSGTLYTQQRGSCAVANTNAGRTCAGRPAIHCLGKQIL